MQVRDAVLPKEAVQQLLREHPGDALWARMVACQTGESAMRLAALALLTRLRPCMAGLQVGWRVWEVLSSLH